MHAWARTHRFNHGRVRSQSHRHGALKKIYFCKVKRSLFAVPRHFTKKIHFCLAWRWVMKRLSNPNVCAACAVRTSAVTWFFVRSIPREPYDLPGWYHGLFVGLVLNRCACWILGMADTYLGTWFAEFMQKFVRSISQEPYAPARLKFAHISMARAEGAHGDLDGRWKVIRVFIMG